MINLLCIVGTILSFVVGGLLFSLLLDLIDKLSEKSKGGASLPCCKK
jgi:hypothetical protein